MRAHGTPMCRLFTARYKVLKRPKKALEISACAKAQLLCVPTRVPKKIFMERRLNAPYIAEILGFVCGIF
jgi:hypothetical protein